MPHVPEPLAAAELAAALRRLPGWRVADNSLVAVFRAARANIRTFYGAVAAVEDPMNHHARVTVLYDTMRLEFVTHDAGNLITARDTAAATLITHLATEHGAAPAHAGAGGA